MRAYLRSALRLITERKQAYVATFAAERHYCMTDLARFCAAFGDDPARPLNHDAMLVQAGRREVFWRIWRHLNLSEVELAAVYKAVEVETGEE